MKQLIPRTKNRIQMLKNNYKAFIFPALLLLVAFLTTDNMQAQQIKHYNQIGPGALYFQTRDKAMSPMIYNGAAGYIQAGYFSNNRDTILNIVNTFFGVGYTRPDHYDYSAATALTFKTGIDYDHLRHVSKIGNTGIDWYAGGAWNTIIIYRENLRFANTAINYDFVSSLSLAAKFHRAVTIWNLDLDLDMKLNVPVISAIVRPSYASSRPEGALDNDEKYVKDFFQSIRIESLNNFQRLRSKISATYWLQNGNGLRLTYDWDYYNYSVVNEVFAATHAVYASLFFKF